MGGLDLFHGGDGKQEYLLSVDDDGTHTLHVRETDTTTWSDGTTLNSLSEVPC